MKYGQLNNGLRYVIDNYKSKYSTDIVFSVGVGSRNEEPGKYGLAHFLEHMIFKGTPTRPDSKAISDSVYKYGGEINATTNYDVTNYSITIQSEHVENGLEVLADMLYNSHFKGIKEERGVVISENKKENTDPKEKMMRYFLQSVFKGTTFQHDVGGTNAQIKKFTKNDAMKFYNKYYGPSNIVLSIAGRVPKNIENIIKKHFGKNKQSQEFKTTIYEHFTNMQKKPRYVSLVSDVDQAQIALGFPAYGYTDKRKYALEVMSAVIGGNMSSRLFIKMREKMGLVYSIRSDVENFYDIGVFMIVFGTFKNKIKQATNAVMDELEKIKKHGITKEELKNNVTYLIGMLSIHMEDNEERASSNGYEYLLYDKIVPMKEIKNILRSVTLDDIKHVANEILDTNKLNYAIITDKKIKNFGFINDF